MSNKKLKEQAKEELKALSNKRETRIRTWLRGLADSLDSFVSKQEEEELEQPSKLKPTKQPQRDWYKSPIRTQSISSILPAPFEWVKVPSLEFKVAKYPITNAQYASFINDGGYLEKKWWSEIGWLAKKAGYYWNPMKKFWDTTGIPWSEPRFWDNDNLNQKEQPVVGISLYEVEAFCSWLKRKSGQNVLLPSWSEWRTAAKLNGYGRYPWGDEWDAQQCIHSIEPFRRNRTEDVRLMIEGSPREDMICDLSGNVFEWCNNNVVASKWNQQPSQKPKQEGKSKQKRTKVDHDNFWLDNDELVTPEEVAYAAEHGEVIKGFDPPESPDALRAWLNLEIETPSHKVLSSNNDPVNDNKVMIAGGSWRSTKPEELEIDTLVHAHPMQRADDIGFRLILA